MSRHSTRKERWTQVNAKEYRALFGNVRYRAGAWEGTVTYQAWVEEAWHAEESSAGRFKRPRNAMIAVEEKARTIARQQGDMAKVDIDD
jgi:hypothetical protein